MNYLKLALLIATAFSSTAVCAIPVTISDSISSSYISSGQSIRGSFDLSSFVPKSPADSYRISSARIIFNFFDDIDESFLTERVYGSYNFDRHYRSRRWNYEPSFRYKTDRTFYVRSRNDTYSTEQELASVTIASSDIYNSASTYNATTTLTSPGSTGGEYTGRQRINGDYCARRKLFTCIQYSPQYIFYYNYYRDLVTTQLNDYGIGDLEILLDDASLLSFAEKGSINYSVSSMSGDFIFDNAVLIADVSVVPEPPAIALVGMGILILRLLRCKKTESASIKAC